MVGGKRWERRGEEEVREEEGKGGRMANKDRGYCQSDKDTVSAAISNARSKNSLVQELGERLLHVAHHALLLLRAG